eukprot:6194599-Pleurochrysis_carterae.AAC.4
MPVHVVPTKDPRARHKAVPLPVQRRRREDEPEDDPVVGGKEALLGGGGRPHFRPAQPGAALHGGGGHAGVGLRGLTRPGEAVCSPPGAGRGQLRWQVLAHRRSDRPTRRPGRRGGGTDPTARSLGIGVDVAAVYQQAIIDAQLQALASISDAAGADMESMCTGWVQPASLR